MDVDTVAAPQRSARDQASSVARPAEERRTDHLTFSEWFAQTLLRWRIVAAAILLALLVGVAAVLILPSLYRSRTTFLTNPSSTPKLSGLMASGPLAGLASQFGVTPGSDPSDSPQMYVQLLGSRELITRLVNSTFANPRTVIPRDSASLLEILRIREKKPERKLEIAVEMMRRAIGAGFDGSTNLVWLEVTTEWPELSAAVANETTDLLTTFNREQRATRIVAKRQYLQKRVDSAATQLRYAESELRSFYDSNRLWRTAPMLVFRESQLRREVDLASGLYLDLVRQLEMARIDEFNDAPMITIVDPAVPQHKRDWPKYGPLVFSCILGGLIIGFLIAGCAAVAADWQKRNPESAWKIRDAVRRTRRDIFRAPWRRRQRAGETFAD